MMEMIETTTVAPMLAEARNAVTVESFKTQANRRHPRAELYPDGDWREVQSCDPVTLSEAIDQFVDQIDANSISLILRGLSPGRGCPNDSIVRFNNLWFR